MGFSRWLISMVVLALALAGGCSVQRAALRAMGPVIDGAVAEAYTSRDLEMAKAALPSQIMTFRGLCRSDPSNAALCGTAVQLYAAYSMAFLEDADPQRALVTYGEGAAIGLRTLRERAWFDRAWVQGPDSLAAALRRHELSGLIPVLFWTASCMAGAISVGMDDPAVLADMPYARALLDAVLEVEGAYFYGMPYALKGSMLAMMPRMLGGDPEEAQEWFDRAFSASGRRFLLHQVLYAKYCCVSLLDRECFEEVLREVLVAPDDVLPEMNLITAMAKAQAQDLLRQADELF